ncbi:MAG: prephenate dehydratase domain-containing protein [Gemmatimonadota bacterium]
MKRSRRFASEAAAQHYSLDNLEKNLEDRADNRTRFVVVTIHDRAPF